MGRAPLDSVAVVCARRRVESVATGITGEHNARSVLNGSCREASSRCRGFMKCSKPCVPVSSWPSPPVRRAGLRQLVFGGWVWRDSSARLQTSDDISRGKPDPEIYLLAMASLSLGRPSALSWKIPPTAPRRQTGGGRYLIAVPSQYTRRPGFQRLSTMSRAPLLVKPQGAYRCGVGAAAICRGWAAFWERSNDRDNVTLVARNITKSDFYRLVRSQIEHEDNLNSQQPQLVRRFTGVSLHRVCNCGQQFDHDSLPWVNDSNVCWSC